MSGKSRAIIALGLTLSAAQSARGAMLDKAEIETAARAFVREGVGAAALEGRSLDSVAARGNLWVAHYAPSGYCVFSGSDRSAPVVGFSENDFVEPGEDDAFYALLAGADEASVVAEADSSRTRDPRWNRLLSKRVLTTKAGVSDYGTVIVSPFLTTHWNQWQPYNDYSPAQTNASKVSATLGGRYRSRHPCGCVATASAQVLAYWRWPVRTDEARTVTHDLYRTPSGNSEDKEPFTIRFDGNVPFDWAGLTDTYYLNLASYDARNFPTVKEASRYGVGRLILFCDSVANMYFWPKGSGATFSPVVANMGKWYSSGNAYNIASSASTAIARAKANIQSGVPVLVSLPRHAVVGHGWAENGTSKYIYLNYGNYANGGGSSDGYYNIADSSVIQEVFVDFKPRAKVQLDPLPSVVGSSMTVGWAFPDCYASEVRSFTVYVDHINALGVPQGDSFSLNADGTARSVAVAGLVAGERYRVQIQPTLTTGLGELSDTLTVRVAATAPAWPEIQSVSSRESGPVFKEGFFRECAIGTNVIAVQCSDNVTSLAAFPSHLTLVPDDHVAVHPKGNGAFDVVVDGSAIPAIADCSRMILTLKATDANGTSVYKDLSLRFSRETAAEAYEAASGGGDPDPDAPVEDDGLGAICVNFTHQGAALSTTDAIGYVPVAGNLWDSVAGVNGTSGTLSRINSTGKKMAIDGSSLRISGALGSWKASNLASSSNILHGYIDDQENTYPAPTVVLTGIPFEKFQVVVYHSTDSDNFRFGYDTVNGVAYTSTNTNKEYDVSFRTVKGMSAWGAAGPKDGARGLCEGVNYLVSDIISGTNAVTVTGHRIDIAEKEAARGCIAAIQIVEVTNDWPTAWSNQRPTDDELAKFEAWKSAQPTGATFTQSDETAFLIGAEATGEGQSLSIAGIAVGTDGNVTISTDKGIGKANGSVYVIYADALENLVNRSAGKTHAKRLTDIADDGATVKPTGTGAAKFFQIFIGYGAPDGVTIDE